MISDMSESAPPARMQRTFAGLQRIVAILRGPDGCPWDKVQTHETLRPYLLEETAEVLDAIDSGDKDALKEELADLLFEVVIHVQLAEESGDFTMADVIGAVSSKLVRRHPHVFGDSSAETPEAVVKQWDDLKAAERGTQPAMAGVPATLPSIARAQTLQRRAARHGFEWEGQDQFWAAFDEEIEEFRQATGDERMHEAGDVMFALANLVRSFGIDGEEALRLANRRFSERFARVESTALAEGVDLQTATMDAKLALWQRAKGTHQIS
jgi:tetrapyrrole methylase family protein/MazG family protein